MAMCVIAVVAVAPCQCFSPGGNHTQSPGRISSTAPPSRCAQPQPAVTINVWPSGCVCHAVRAPGSNVTLAPTTRAGSGAVKSGSMRTLPVKYSAGPLPDGCEPIRLISTVLNLAVSEDRRHWLLYRQLVQSASPSPREPFLRGPGESDSRADADRALHL